MDGIVENAEEKYSHVKKAWFFTLIQGGISSVIGLILMIFPNIGMVFVSLVFSFYLIWIGISQIVLAYKLSSAQTRWWMLLLRGVAMFICGIVVLVFPLSFAKIGTGVPLVLIGLFLIFNGLQDLLAKSSPGKGVQHSMSAIIMLLTGALLCFAPVSSALLMFRILGFTTLSGGLLLMARAFFHRRWVMNDESESEKPL